MDNELELYSHDLFKVLSRYFPEKSTEKIAGKFRMRCVLAESRTEFLPITSPVRHC